MQVIEIGIEDRLINSNFQMIWIMEDEKPTVNRFYGNSIHHYLGVGGLRELHPYRTYITDFSKRKYNRAKILRILYKLCFIAVLPTYRICRLIFGSHYFSCSKDVDVMFIGYA